MDPVEREYQRHLIQRSHRVSSYLTRFLKSLVYGKTWSETFLHDDPVLTNEVRLFEAQLRRALVEYGQSATLRSSAA
jgi:hypothetical protein